MHEELARAAELAGRWADVERSCDAMLAMLATSDAPDAVLPVQQRRLQARLRLGHRRARDGARVPRAARRRRSSTASRTWCTSARCSCRRSQRMGRVDEAICIAEDSLGQSEARGDEALTGEALHRLAQTLLAPRPADAVELLLALVALRARRKDPALEARAFLGLGVARTRTRDDLAAVEAFRLALRIGLDAQALDVAATCVDEPRRARAAARRLRRGARAHSTKHCGCTRRCGTTRAASARCTTSPCWRPSAATWKRRARSIARRRRWPSSSARTSSRSARTRARG